METLFGGIGVGVLRTAFIAATVKCYICGVFSATYLYINDVLIISTKVAVIVRGSLTLLVFGSFFVFLVIRVYDLK